MRTAFLSTMVLVLMAAGAQDARANSYTLVDLGKQNLPTQINDDGQISGFRGQTVKAIEYRAGRWHYLAFADRQGFASAIDEKGNAVGEQAGVAVMWERFGRRTDLALPDGAVFSEATSVSSDFQTVGYYQTTAGGPTRCFLTRPNNGVALDLGFPPGGDRCFAAAINKYAEIVGTADFEPGGPSRAFVWSSGIFHDLGTLPGGSSSAAYAINNRGQVVGEAATSTSGQTHAFFAGGGRMLDIGKSSRFYNSRAMAVNDLRDTHPEIVGIGFNADGTHVHAVRFDHQRGPVALEDEVVDIGDWHLAYAMSINNHGVIVGQGQRKDGPHGYMLLPRD